MRANFPKPKSGIPTSGTGAVKKFLKNKTKQTVNNKAKLPRRPRADTPNKKEEEAKKTTLKKADRGEDGGARNKKSVGDRARAVANHAKAVAKTAVKKVIKQGIKKGALALFAAMNNPIGWGATGILAILLFLIVGAAGSPRDAGVQAHCAQNGWSGAWNETKTIDLLHIVPGGIAAKAAYAFFFGDKANSRCDGWEVTEAANDANNQVFAEAAARNSTVAQHDAEITAAFEAFSAATHLDDVRPLSDGAASSGEIVTQFLPHLSEPYPVIVVGVGERCEIPVAERSSPQETPNISLKWWLDITRINDTRPIVGALPTVSEHPCHLFAAAELLTEVWKAGVVQKGSVEEGFLSLPTGQEWNNTLETFIHLGNRTDWTRELRIWFAAAVTLTQPDVTAVRYDCEIRSALNDNNMTPLEAVTLISLGEPLPLATPLPAQFRLNLNEAAGKLLLLRRCPPAITLLASGALFAEPDWDALRERTPSEGELDSAAFAAPNLCYDWVAAEQRFLTERDEALSAAEELRATVEADAGVLEAEKALTQVLTQNTANALIIEHDSAAAALAEKLLAAATKAVEVANAEVNEVLTAEIEPLQAQAARAAADAMTASIGAQWWPLGCQPRSEIEASVSGTYGSPPAPNFLRALIGRDGEATFAVETVGSNSVVSTIRLFAAAQLSDRSTRNEGWVESSGLGADFRGDCDWHRWISDACFGTRTPSPVADAKQIPDQWAASSTQACPSPETLNTWRAQRGIGTLEAVEDEPGSYLTYTYGGVRVHPCIADSVSALFRVAEATNFPLSGGAYRDRLAQHELRESYDAAVQAGGSPAPVAEPGRSNHNYGLAVDFSYALSIYDIDGVEPAALRESLDEDIATGVEVSADEGVQPDEGEELDNVATRALCREDQNVYNNAYCHRWLTMFAPLVGLQQLPSEPWHWSIDGN